MASPLPHPSKDTPQRPNPNRPGQSPWLPGKSPAVPGQGLAKKGASNEDQFTKDNNNVV